MSFHGGEGGGDVSEPKETMGFRIFIKIIRELIRE